MTDSTAVAVVIPAFHAEHTLATVVAGIPPWVRWIVIVDDASTDATGAVAARCAATDPRVRVERHATNAGVGGAVLTGYRAALALGAAVMVKMDSDDQMDPAHLLRLVSPVVEQKADYTKGNRFLHRRALSTMPVLRRLGNLALSFMSKASSGYWSMFDPTNGYTAISAAAARLVLEDDRYIGRRYFFEISMLQELGILRAVVADMAMPARYGTEKSHLSIWQTLVEFPVRMLRGLVRRIWLRHFIQDFGPIGLCLVVGTLLLAWGVLFGGWHWIINATAGRVTPVGTVMLAVLPTLLGIQALMMALSIDMAAEPRNPLSRDEAAVE